MGWFERLFGRQAYSVSVDKARSTFLYRENGRRLYVSGEAMADGYAVYSASIQEWQAARGNAPAPPLIDEAERMRIATNIRSYFVERGKAIYLS